MDRRAFVVATFAATGALLGSSCASRAVRSDAERHELSGRVVSIDGNSGRVTVAHKVIPGFMDAMTMEFVVEPPSILSTLTPGDRIRATLVVDAERSWLEGIERLEGSSAGFDVDEATDPDIGAPVPAFSLIDQSGRRFGLERLAGRPVLVTFLYTQCPLPDYCARMTSNFEAVARALDAASNDRAALVCISIDPEHDTPDVLSAYADQHVTPSAQIDRWTFATGSVEEVRAIAGFFGLSYETQSGQIVHSLRTVVVSPQGKVAAILRGNTWTADEAVAELMKADGAR